MNTDERGNAGTCPPPLASLVIPTYNRAELLRRQLETLVAQRCPPGRFEVIVADDGSSDHTAAVVESFAGRLPITYVAQPDEGFRAAAVRNRGAELARAEILIFLDTGALVGPDFVDAHLAAQAAPGPTAAGGGRVVLGYVYGYNPYQPFPGLAEELEGAEAGEVVRRHADDPRLWDLRHRELAACDFDLGRLAAPWMHAWTLNLSLRTADFRAVGGFDEDYRSWGGEDLELGYRLHDHGLPLTFSRQAWALEFPHERELDVNGASSRANAWLMWDKHRVPVIELYATQYSHDEWDPPLEYEYQKLLAWQRRARPLDVRDEVAAAVADQPDGARVVVLGSGGTPPAALAPGPRWTVVDFDADLLASAATGGGDGVHAIGLRTALPTGCADLVVLTSRLRGLWERWSPRLLTEAWRLGDAVRVPFAHAGGDR
jgi:glycosyltransferase involved in cell wall biosynthesis